MRGHTSGPWHIAHEIEAKWNVLAADGSDVAITQMRARPGKEDPERDANTRLIAAAPEMYAALQALIAHPWGKVAREDARKLIKRILDGDA